MLICKIKQTIFAAIAQSNKSLNLFKDLKIACESKRIVIIRSSYEERMEDALALSAEEGRDKLR